MTWSPMLLFHVTAGVVGLVSGGVAVALRKGSRRHAVVGSVFVVSMLCMSAAGAFMAIMKSQPGNILGGIFTFYLVATAWRTGRRREGKPGMFEWVGLLVVLVIATVEVTLGTEALNSPTGLKYGYSFGPYFFLGSVAVLALAGDIRVLVRGGISGAQRIARHLWRMCFALFIASSSVFLARQHLFPALMRKTGVLIFLSVLPVLLMIFWLVRVLFTNAFRRTTPSLSKRTSGESSRGDFAGIGMAGLAASAGTQPQH